MHLVSDSKRLSFSHELTPTLNLGLSLTLAWGHFQDIKFFIYTSFKDFSLNVYDDTNLLHLVSDSQRLSFSQVLTPTLTLSLTLGLGLGLTLQKTIRVENLKPNAKHGIGRSRAGKSLLNLCRYKIFYRGSDSKLALTVTLRLTLVLGLGLTPGKTISVNNLKPNAKD